MNSSMRETIVINPMDLHFGSFWWTHDLINNPGPSPFQNIWDFLPKRLNDPNILLWQGMSRDVKDVTMGTNPDLVDHPTNRKEVISQLISGKTLQKSPVVTGDITFLLSGMIHRAVMGSTNCHAFCFPSSCPWPVMSILPWRLMGFTGYKTEYSLDIPLDEWLLPPKKITFCYGTSPCSTTKPWIYANFHSYVCLLGIEFGK